MQIECEFMNEISCKLSESGIAIRMNNFDGIWISGTIKSHPLKEKIHLTRHYLSIRNFSLTYSKNNENENEIETNLDLMITFIRYFLTIFEIRNIKIQRCNIFHEDCIFHVEFLTENGKIKPGEIKKNINKKISIRPLFENILLKCEIPQDLIKIILEFGPVDICGKK